MISRLSIRSFEFLVCAVGICILSPLMISIFIGCAIDTKRPLIVQRRIGRHKKTFLMIKFRSMMVATPETATHELTRAYTSAWGRWIRKTKLDELPQMFNVLMGSMSLVGPRPNLESQEKLTCSRERRGIYQMRPGVTGLAQIKGITMERERHLLKLDKFFISHFSFRLYFYVLIKTFF